MTTSFVAVIVPSWNSSGLLPRCLGSLEAQGVEPELLVVDNGSKDGSLAYLEREEVPHIALPHNIGFAAAVNLGIQRTSAPAVLVLNADAVLEPGCLEKLSVALEADRRLGGVQPRILQTEAQSSMQQDVGRARLYSSGQALTRDGRAFEEGAGESQSDASRRPHEIFGVCGAACLLRREMVEGLAGYDERYFAFYEDVDLNVRARIAGWRFAFVPEAVAWHIGNASWMAGFARPRADNARMVARNRLATQVKFMPGTAVPKIAIAEVGSLGRALLQRRFWATLSGKLEALRWLPALLSDRRRLQAKGDLVRARQWLGVRTLR